MAQNICQSKQGYLYTAANSQVMQLSGAVTTLPQTATSLVAQFTTIPASVTGMAAPAAAPMVLGVKSQAQGLKSQLSQALATAVSLGIDIPGIDPLLMVAQILAPLL